MTLELFVSKIKTSLKDKTKGVAKCKLWAFNATGNLSLNVLLRDGDWYYGEDKVSLDTVLKLNSSPE